MSAEIRCWVREDQNLKYAAFGEVKADQGGMTSWKRHEDLETGRKDIENMPKVYFPISNICLRPILCLGRRLKTLISFSPPFHSKDLDLRLF